MDIARQVTAMARDARAAARHLATVSSGVKNNVLRAAAALLMERKSYIQEENRKDLDAARQQLSPHLIDRLTLSDTVIQDMAAALDDVCSLPDPVGEITNMWKRPNGLLVGRMRIPLGVVGMIYESRPNVTIDAGALCFKAGNAVLLRGGKEAINSNRALADILQEALRSEDIPPGAVQVIPFQDRQAVMEMLALQDYIDVIIPRGGEALIKTVYENSHIPVIAHYKGVCHVYIDESADPDTARRIACNAKVQRPGVCNAMETLLVHRGFARAHLRDLVDSLQDQGVTIRGCGITIEMTDATIPATEEDWHTEYLDLTLSVRVVETMEEALDHIDRYGSKHTEAIVTERYDASRRFIESADSSVVLVNASTRFNDGNQLGLGAEIGISTSKLHAFGPMGLQELTTTKFIVYGEGQTRE